MKDFRPNYMNLVNAAKNIEPNRIPLYEHIVAVEVIEDIIGVKFDGLNQSRDMADLRLFFKNYCSFFKQMGYDTVSWEMCIGHIMPDSGALGGHKPGIIKDRKDFEKYPWDTIKNSFFDNYSRHFEALRLEMPEGMKAVGGPGNGIFECVQELVGYENLCIISFDDPELYADLFKKVGEINLGIWKRFLNEFGDIYAVCRFGDDLGFKSSTLLPPDDIRKHIIPQYKNIVEAVHNAEKPFILHSCGCIFDVMDDVIENVGIDAKHSNEDAIAPFSKWVTDYGDKIGNFGGIDMDILCQKTADEIKAYTINILESSAGHGGIAIGSGNSIPDYVPAEGYMAMINTVRQFRGDQL
jgi:uroporphyrinogen decarboxylase